MAVPPISGGVRSGCLRRPWNPPAACPLRAARGPKGEDWMAEACRTAAHGIRAMFRKEAPRAGATAAA
ncbi:MAG: hypothetical protein WB626_08305, partial [Bacteroidota bacterium]